MTYLSYLNTTIETTTFQVEDVISDNACFYRAISNSLAFFHSSTIAAEILKVLEFNTDKPIQEFYNHDDWGFNGEEQEILSREIQNTIYNFVSTHNKNTLIPIEESIDMTLDEIIKITHDISYEQYIELYKHYAGDIICDKEKENVGILKDRWGGFCEQLIVSYIYKIPIISLIPLSFNKQHNKPNYGIIKNNKPYKNVRYKIGQITGNEYLKRGKRPIFILWKKVDDSPHYMSMYPINIETCISSLNNILE